MPTGHATRTAGRRRACTRALGNLLTLSCLQASSFPRPLRKRQARASTSSVSSPPARRLASPRSTRRASCPVRGSGFDFIGSYGWRVHQLYDDVGGDLRRRNEGMEHLTAIHLRAAVSPTPWFQIAAHVPILQFPIVGVDFDDIGGSPEANNYGFGDTTLELGFRALPEERGAGIAFIPFVTAPSGTRALLLSHVWSPSAPAWRCRAPQAPSTSQATWATGSSQAAPRSSTPTPSKTRSSTAQASA